MVCNKLCEITWLPENNEKMKQPPYEIVSNYSKLSLEEKKQVLQNFKSYYLMRNKDFLFSLFEGYGSYGKSLIIENAEETEMDTLIMYAFYCMTPEVWCNNYGYAKQTMLLEHKEHYGRMCYLFNTEQRAQHVLMNSKYMKQNTLNQFCDIWHYILHPVFYKNNYSSNLLFCGL